MEVFNAVISTIRGSYPLIFSSGVALGMGFELFKIKFSVNGISFYRVFNRMQIKRELERFEKELNENNLAAEATIPFIFKETHA